MSTPNPRPPVLVLSSEEREVLNRFDDIAATILVLQREGFSSRSNESLMDNFTRHTTLLFGGIMSANQRIDPMELAFFNHMVRGHFSLPQFEAQLRRYQRGKNLEDWVDWVPEYLDTLVAFDRLRDTGTADSLLQTLQALGEVCIRMDGDEHPRQKAFMARHLQSLQKHLTRVRQQQHRSQEATAPPLERMAPRQIHTTGPVQINAGELPFCARTLEGILTDIDGLIGLAPVKEEVRNLSNMLRISALRRQQDLPVPPLSHHLVFTGNPGTGKTTIARRMAEIYTSLGVLSQGQLIEVDRSGLVAGYMGQTALKTREVIEQALGGILFVDEAYALAGESGQDFGREAIETLLKAMEDHRENLVVIVAGYADEMKHFIQTNPGLRSRFKRFIHFPDYQGQELALILKHLFSQHHFVLSPEAETFAQKACERLYQRRGEHFGNGRTMRNIFEQTLSFQAGRLVALEAPDREALSQIDVRDLIAGFKAVLNGF
ncbi:MAG: AAA family ATPase [Candidatus Sericytochromatia bacterium]|nr:AAA family ATPase [Candidatus Sericytochromatia bacterium]